MLQINPLFADIRTGKYDFALNELRREISERQQLIAPKPAIRSFHTGARVKFKPNVRPSYLNGMTAFVTKVNRKRVKIRIEHPEQLVSHRFAGPAAINCPTSILELI